MSFLKSLFSPVMQRETVLEHLIETLARNDDHCEYVKVISFENAQEFMTAKKARIVWETDPYPRESTVYNVRVGANDYDVRVSRAEIGLPGVLITSKFAGTDDYPKLIAEYERYKIEEADAINSLPDPLLEMVEESLSEQAIAIREAIGFDKIEAFYNLYWCDVLPDWRTFGIRGELRSGGGIVELEGHGKCLVLCATMPSHTLMNAQTIPIGEVAPDQLPDLRLAVAEGLEQWESKVRGIHAKASYPASAF